MSRIGKLPVAIPAGVKVTVSPDTMTVEGPKGKLTQTNDASPEIKPDGNNAFVTRRDDSKQTSSLHGL